MTVLRFFSSLYLEAYDRHMHETATIETHSLVCRESCTAESVAKRGPNGIFVSV
jgi:hypothetical protein